MNIASHRRSLVAISLLLAAAGCPGGPEEDDDLCRSENHCLRVDGEVICEDGYEWEDASDPENYNCVEVPPPAECLAVNNCQLNDDGEPECEIGYAWSDEAALECEWTGWAIEDEIDPLTDEREIQFITTATESYNDWLGRSVTPGLTILCKDGQSLIGFYTGPVETDINDILSVTIRFDSLPAEEDVPAIETNDVIVFEPETGERFANATYDATERVVLDFPAYETFAPPAIFDVSNFSDVAQPYVDVCGF